GGRGRHARVHAVGDLQEEDAVPARLPHGGVGRAGDARRRHLLGRSPPHRRRLRDRPEEEVPPALRRLRRVLGPGGDDPQRRLLLRDRPRRRGPVGHPRPPLPLDVGGGGDPAGPPHAGDLLGADRGDGRRGLAARAAPQGLGNQEGRRDHPPGRDHRHGLRSREVGPQPVLPVVGRQEPLRDRRRLLRLQRRQEPHAQHHGRRLARVRLHRGRDEEEEPVGGAMSDTPDVKKGVSRRLALKVLGGVPAAMAAAPGLVSAAPPAPLPGPANTLAPAPGMPAPPPVAAAKGAYVPQFFSEGEWKTASLLADMIIPKDERSGSATDARTVEYIDEYAAYWGGWVQPRLRGGLMWLDRECGLRFEKPFADCTDAQRPQGLRRIAY